jgi:hypothetical protein
MAIKSQDMKVAQVIAPAAIVDNAVYANTVVNTHGYDYCTILVNVGVTDIAMAALKVQECDTSGGTYADVTGLVYGTSTNIDGSTSALPTSTADNTVVAFDIDLRGRKKYLQLVGQAGDGSSGTYASAVALLSRGDKAPTNAAERGCGQVLRV